METANVAALIDTFNRHGERYFAEVASHRTNPAWRDPLEGEFAQAVKELIIALISCFRSADSALRTEISKRLSLSACKLLLGFAGKCAVLAVRQSDPRLIELGLSALILDDGNDDWRHSVIAMAVLYHSARRLGIDADEVFERVARDANEGAVRDEMTGFPKRSKADRDLEAFWLRESTGPEGFTYEQFRW